MSSNAYFNPMMLRLLVVRSRTARSSIYSEKAEIKSPREVLLPGSAGIRGCPALTRTVEPGESRRRCLRSQTLEGTRFDIASFRPLVFSCIVTATLVWKQKRLRKLFHDHSYNYRGRTGRNGNPNQVIHYSQRSKDNPVERAHRPYQGDARQAGSGDDDLVSRRLTQ